jgi:hypothetical protein
MHWQGLGVVVVSGATVVSGAGVGGAGVGGAGVGGAGVGGAGVCGSSRHEIKIKSASKLASLQRNLPQGIGGGIGIIKLEQKGIQSPGNSQLLVKSF